MQDEYRMTHDEKVRREKSEFDLILKINNDLREQKESLRKQNQILWECAVFYYYGKIENAKHGQPISEKIVRELYDSGSFARTCIGKLQNINI